MGILVDHTRAPDEPVTIGCDVGSQALSRTVEWPSENRVPVNGTARSPSADRGGPYEVCRDEQPAAALGSGRIGSPSHATAPAKSMDPYTYSCAMSNYTSDGGTAGPAVNGVQSVDRAVSVLEILARRGEAGVSEVAAEIDVHKSTAFRLLGALEARGLVEQTAERGKYRLGFGIVRLAGAVTGRLDITQQGRQVCERLIEEIGETVNIAVLQEHYAVNLYQVRGPGAVGTHNWVGQLTPVHATSSGKILLAHLSPDERAEVLADSGMQKLTPHTLTARTKLEKNLAEARERGYAVTLEELEIGLHAMAAPIRARDGEVIAALSASGPAYRFTEERMHELAPVLLKGAEEISHRMGYLG